MKLNDKKLLIISGSKSDKLTRKLLNTFEKYSINYLLVDYENLNLFYSLKKKLINIDQNFTVENLIKFIKKIDKKVIFKKDCIFLFEFRSGISKSKWEYEFSVFVRKNNFKRFKGVLTLQEINDIIGSLYDM